MVTKICKWGNSLGLRIPKSIANEVEVAEGTSVDVRIHGSQLIVTPVQPMPCELDELLAQVKRSNVHAGIPTSDPIGREVW